MWRPVCYWVHPRSERVEEMIDEERRLARREKSNERGRKRQVDASQLIMWSPLQDFLSFRNRIIVLLTYQFFFFFSRRLIKSMSSSRQIVVPNHSSLKVNKRGWIINSWQIVDWTRRGRRCGGSRHKSMKI